MLVMENDNSPWNKPSDNSLGLVSMLEGRPDRLKTTDAGGLQAIQAQSPYRGQVQNARAIARRLLRAATYDPTDHYAYRSPRPSSAR
ncbi:hypothetical protein NM688_g3585 [Phlebia brevispora]|uniref:Uncharacterized protein n=1 Tax=Phlebia brevispora TaxID=194682 RepID=A0ACC1T5I4_9APHY|nr:hypothetical protein NM688_g3585 [Phlebia brevispora]